jgi:hypothetical protein
MKSKRANEHLLMMNHSENLQHDLIVAYKAIELA